MTSSTLIHVGVIGAGRIGKVHAEHLACRISNARLAAVSDIDRAAAKACADRFHVTKVYSDAEPVLADSSIDAVAICSSTNTHAPLIEAAAAAGKHIFCEKPVDFDLERIDRCLRAVDKAGVKFQVGFNRRFDPNFWEVRRKITEGRVGDVQIVRITSRDPAPPPIDYIRVSGGMFLDMTIHDFDMARYLVDSEVETVYAAGGVLVDPAIGQAGDIDTALITLHFANGALASIDNCRRAVYGYDQRVEVFGSKGMVRAENNTPTRTQLCDEAGIHSPLPLHFFMDRYIDSYVMEMKLFIEAIVNDTPPPVSGLDGLAPVVIGLAAKRSLAENRPVNVAEIR
ncbi:MAG: inositol 2-dehydrogenase [Candidatus Omnitrophica bacterium]|nr:inositol 2-dehydrogenase [Candidatus Omnitrophota bacterium]HXK94952.1 inositol 2-dehydrogenase [bacterium]